MAPIPKISVKTFNPTENFVLLRESSQEQYLWLKRNKYVRYCLQIFYSSGNTRPKKRPAILTNTVASLNDLDFFIFFIYTYFFLYLLKTTEDIGLSMLRCFELKLAVIWSLRRSIGSAQNIFINALLMGRDELAWIEGENKKIRIVLFRIPSLVEWPLANINKSKTG